MAPDIATRIKSKLLRRRHSSSAAPSLISSSRSIASSTDNHSLLTPQKPAAVQASREASTASAASRTQPSASGRSSFLVTNKSDNSNKCSSDSSNADEEDRDEDGEGDGPDAKDLHNTLGTSEPNAGDPQPAATQPQPQLSHEPPSPSPSQSQSLPLPSPRPPQSSAGRLQRIEETSPTSPTSDRAHQELAAAATAALNRSKRPGPLELDPIPRAPASFIQLDPPSQFPSTSNTPNTAAYIQPPPLPRRQSLVSHRQIGIAKALLNGPSTHDTEDAHLDLDAVMVSATRKIWVKRPHASPTLVTINEDDLVDDVRDMILRKYANSLGRSFDSPDIALRIAPRDQSQNERFLGPEEHMARIVDAYFPGGQTVDEALVIDIPRRTPKPSPRPAGLYPSEDGRPSEGGEGYFPPVNGSAHSPNHQFAVPVPAPNGIPHSISVLGTGHIPAIPSPGSSRTARQYRERADRPRLGRTHTSSPNVLSDPNTGAPPVPADSSSHASQQHGHRPSHSRAQSNSSEQKPAVPAGAAPTSPVASTSHARVATPPPRISSPRPSANRVKKVKKPAEFPSNMPGILGGSVPPISVLIVEDNPINLKLLEAFVKKLKVRWQTAMNGKDAVDQWRTGGFHLVLMDIQLPVMSGLEATREIRRLERLNSIGVFSSTSSSSGSQPEEDKEEVADADRLENIGLFKSPVIIVALTASSLQSDRHDALAAGCNDFLTKPVNFVWLERKVMEWGCMQALIDFDGWRQWKDFSQPVEEKGKNTSTKAKPRKKSSLAVEA
ncbi:uncharacterized protein F5Z01DRAFT_674314 [Emericellopsis atlantica]|uniref:Response regulatory domain-containing protein n=1 Tax=Emericellopsis atlantica TaxID=2614577 RepID=A0A9P8CPA8_9HYPO|nr:uncharacterized protein F5Z01DRAFT_674314 [Emericellopsis atlantica]KAG9253992.1 hypothetical protein F5Z01DRAFT_674314 [Emericellopsis atlantica]